MVEGNKYKIAINAFHHNLDAVYQLRNFNLEQMFDHNKNNMLQLTNIILVFAKNYSTFM